MSFIVTKSTNRVEYRVYTDLPEDPKEILIYKGHKLGVSDELLEEIINYKHEVSTGNNYYLRYDVWMNKYKFENPLNIMVDLWRPGMDIKNKDLFDSWLNLIRTLQLMSDDNFKNIWVVKINI